jgi:hypothetical protein
MGVTTPQSKIRNFRVALMLYFEFTVTTLRTLLLYQERFAQFQATRMLDVVPEGKG